MMSVRICARIDLLDGIGYHPLAADWESHRPNSSLIASRGQYLSHQACVSG
jgi:hypothetical protein